MREWLRISYPRESKFGLKLPLYISYEVLNPLYIRGVIIDQVASTWKYSCHSLQGLSSPLLNVFLTGYSSMPGELVFDFSKLVTGQPHHGTTSVQWAKSHWLILQ